MRGQRAALGTIRQCIHGPSTKRGFVRVRNFIKVDDRACKLIGGRGGWIPLARHNWLQANGPGSIPDGSEIIHRRPPADLPFAGLLPDEYGPPLSIECQPVGIYGPPNPTVDDISNLVLVPRGGLVEKIHINKSGAKKQRTRRNIAVVRSNQRRCRIQDALHIKPHRWYPVELGSQQVVMRSARTCKAVTKAIKGRVGMIAVRGEELLEENGPYDGWRRFVPVIEGMCPEDDIAEPVESISSPLAESSCDLSSDLDHSN